MKKNLINAFEVTNTNVENFLDLMKENKKEEYLIFEKKLTKENKEKIKKSGCCHFVRVNKIIRTKFVLFLYLRKYQNIIFTDMKYQFSKDLKMKYLPYSFATLMDENCYVEHNFNKWLKKYKMLEPNVNSSILFLKDDLKYFQIFFWCYASFFKYFKMTINKENAIINLMLQKFNINPKFISINLKENVKDSKNYPLKIKKFQKKIKGQLVTIIMTLYDREEYYKEAIESILNQTYINIELIIILEYSKIQDKLEKELKKQKDNRIKIIKNTKKLGFAESLNVGIRYSKGKYIARMDDDDSCEQNRIEKQVEYFEKNSQIGIVGTFMQFFGESNLVCKLPIHYEDLKVTCLYKTPLFHPTVMFNTKIVKKEDIDYKSGVFAEDYDLWSKLISKYKIANIPEILYHYRLNGQNTSKSNEKEMNMSHLKIMSTQLKEYLNIELTFDELQLISGRIDVLGVGKNKEEIYRRKIKVWQKIQEANHQLNYCNENSIKNLLKEIEEYYELIK